MTETRLAYFTARADAAEATLARAMIARDFTDLPSRHRRHFQDLRDRAQLLAHDLGSRAAAKRNTQRKEA